MWYKLVRKKSVFIHSEVQTNMTKFVMRFREADTKLAPRLTEGRRTQHKTTNVGLNVK